MLQCAFTTSFFGFLRCGEFTCLDKGDRLGCEGDRLGCEGDRLGCEGDRLGCELMQDIYFQLDSNTSCFILTLRSSKTDPFHNGVNITIFENVILHPVQTMRNYVQYRYSQGAKPDSPLFVESEFDLRTLSRDNFISLLKQLLQRCGRNVSHFNGHSFRIGAATSAAAAGVEDHVIQTLG